MSRRFGRLGTSAPGVGAGTALRTTLQRGSNAALAARVGQQVRANGFIPQTGIEENNGSPYQADSGYVEHAAQRMLSQPLQAGINLPSYVNPYRTLMYSITGISLTIPVQAIPGNLKRTYLMIQNLGPGNLYVGLGVNPNSGGTNVLNLVSTQVYEQVGGGFFLPPNPWYPEGISIPGSFVSPEYISLMTDTVDTKAMVLEGTWRPPRQGQQTPGT